MDDGLKQRLVGAIVLVAIAVLFLPSLFNRDSRRSVDLSTQIPPKPPVIVERLEVAEPEQPENIPAAKPLAENYPHEEVLANRPDSLQEGRSDAADSPASAQSEAQAEAASPPAKDTESAAPALNAQGVPEAWSLQVASFQSSERAENMLQRLQAEGYKSYIRKANTTQGKVHRVFVGPKINKAAAQAEKQSIDEHFNTSALIVEFKP